MLIDTKIIAEVIFGVNQIFVTVNTERKRVSFQGDRGGQLEANADMVMLHRECLMLGATPKALQYEVPADRVSFYNQRLSHDANLKRCPVLPMRGFPLLLSNHWSASPCR
jgi:hypothetical protein